MEWRRQRYSCQTSNIDASKKCRNARSRLVNITQPFKARIRDRDSSFLGIYGSIRKIGGFTEVLNVTSWIFLSRELEKWIPVSDRTLKNDDLPTFGRPNQGGVSVEKMVEWQKQTYDADLKVIARTTQESLLLYDSFLWGHSLFYQKRTSSWEGRDVIKSIWMHGKYVQTVSHIAPLHNMLRLIVLWSFFIFLVSAQVVVQT